MNPPAPSAVASPISAHPAAISANTGLPASYQGSATLPGGTGIGSSPGTSTKTSDTVFSSGDINDTVIPGNAATIDNLSQRGTYADASGNQRYSDGTYVPVPQGAAAGDNAYSLNGENYAAPASDTSFSDKAEADSEAQLNNLKSTLDSNSAAQISAIQQQYEALKQQQAQINAGLQASIDTSLTNGESSRYAQVSSAGISAAEKSFGLSNIAKIDAEEQSASAGAKSAQQSGDYQVADRLTSLAESKRAEKQAAAQKIIDANSAKLEANQKLQQQSLRDDAVSQALQKGLTDPDQILDYLNKQGTAGGNFTAAEVSGTMKNLAPAGDTTKLTGSLGEFFALQKAKIPLPASVAALPPDQQPYAYVKYKANLDKATTAAKPSGSSPAYKFSTINRGKLINTGLSDSDVNSLQSDIGAHGLTEVLNNADSGLSEEQKNLLREEFANTKTPAADSSSSSADDSTGGP